MKGKPDIIFIVLDGVGAQSLSCYGNAQKTTPQLDAFAKNCVVYRKAFTPANNSNSSHTSILTGLYPREHGTTAEQPFFMKQDFSLAAVLRNTGYATCLINPVYLLSDYFGHTFGFDKVFQMWQCLQQSSSDNIFFNSDFARLSPSNKFHCCLKRIMYPATSISTFKSIINLVYSRMFDIYKDSAHSTRRAVDAAIKVFRQRKEAPVFLYLVLLEAHEEYNPPGYIRKKFNIPRGLKSCHQLDHYTGKIKLDAKQFKQQREMYEAAVYYQDSQLGKLLRYLNDSGISDNAMIVITGDHGEHFGEKGHCGNLASLYNEIIHIPLLIKYPVGAVVQPGNEDLLVQTTDIYATALDLLGFPKRKNSFSLLGQEKRAAVFSQMLPQSILLSTLFRDNVQPDQNFRRQLSQELRCVIRKDGLKYITSEDSERLYNLTVDPQEEIDLSGGVQYKGTKEELNRLLNEFFTTSL